jgi:hypothetical protein
MRKSILIGCLVGMLASCASFGTPQTTQTVANDAQAAVTDTANVASAVTAIATDLAKAIIGIAPVIANISAI